MLDIEKSGYLLFKNVLTPIQLGIAEDTIKPNNMVDYNQLKKFIDQIYLNKLNSILGWNCTYNKFRLSSSSNSNLKDAASFHGDVYNFTKNDTIPIYTALCYLDSATVEVIPGTHKGKVKSDAYKSRVQLNINPGDIIIFQANLHHRGIPGNNARRLIQIFEIFKNEESFNMYNPRFLTVLTSQCWPIKFMYNKTKLFIKQSQEQSQEQSKSTSTDVGFTLIDKLHYWLVVNNIQYSLIGLDIPFESKVNKFVGYEPGPRDIIKPNQTQPLNINMIVRSHPTEIPSCIQINLAIILILGLIIWFLFYKTKLFKNKL